MVIPNGHDRTEDVLTALIRIVDPAVVEGHHVPEQVKVIGIAEPAVYRRDSRLSLATVAP